MNPEEVLFAMRDFSQDHHWLSINTATIRHLLMIMKKMVTIFGNSLCVEWVYEKDDEEIRERGQDLSEILKFPFSFKMI